MLRIPAMEPAKLSAKLEPKHSHMYASIDQLEPLMPADIGELEDIARELTKQSAMLAGQLPPGGRGFRARAISMAGEPFKPDPYRILPILSRSVS